MYYTAVLLLLLVCPLGSVLTAMMRSHQPLSAMLLVRWWTFWAVGVRLFVAGARQVLQPRFTAAEIFRIDDAKVFPIVREVGSANLAMATVALCSLLYPGWVLPAAITGGLYYGFAALIHLSHKNRNGKEYTAMVSDALVCAILLGCTVIRLL